MPRPTYVLVPGALRRELESRGLSVAEVAAASGLLRKTVRNVVADRYRSVECATALKLLIVLDAPPSTLLVMPDVALQESRESVRQHRQRPRGTEN